MYAVLLFLGLWCVSQGTTLLAQNVSANLTGTVADVSGAVIPNATVTLTSEATGVVRRTVSNNEGFFSVSAIQPGSYDLTIDAPGFQKWEEKGIVFNPGDKRNVSNIAMAVGTSKETVTVTDAAATITPVDSGEKASVISTKELQNVSVIGRNAAEFIKILPGMALTGSLSNAPGYTGENQGTNSGPIGSFSANGTRSGALDITSDGAHVIDPGCNCGQAVNTDIDFTQEMKVQTSNFGADVQKGPVVVSAVGKSGTSQFHGEGYLYARNGVMNANDWSGNAAGLARPDTSHYYPGGNISGPVLIPGTGFNKNRDKLFFFFGAEYFKQVIDNGIYRAFVPTQEMRNGNFSQSYLDAYIGNTSPGSSVTSAPNFPGGIVPADQISPIGRALMNLYPLPNADPKANRGFNFVQQSTKPQDMFQLRPRVDWNISDNTKFFVSYNRQRDQAYYTDTLWWRPDPTVPYPSTISAKNASDSWSANLTHVFSPTLTSETVFTYTVLDLPNTFTNPKKVDRNALGLGYKTIFNNNISEIPSITGWSDGVANLIQPSGYQVTGALFADKLLPTFAENLSKVWGTHTMKFGMYWEHTANDQPASGNANGVLTFSNWGPNSTGNAYADMLTGNISQYQETNFDPRFRMSYTTMDFYATDSWKVTRRLTLDYGLRFSHLGPWIDQDNIGLAIFDPSKYSASAPPTALTGMLWHKIDASVPNSGSGSRALFYEPRFGFAWDIFGSGKTVLRGGFGVYRFHDEQNVQAGSIAIGRGSYTYTSPYIPLDYTGIGQLSASFAVPGSIQVLQRGDTEQPETKSYSFTISQRMPFASLFEVSYVGTDSTHLSNWNNNFGQLNDIPFGTLFKAGAFAGGNLSPDASSYRPFANYGTIKQVTHQMYSNYNSLQASWNKQAGRSSFLVNYTFSKSLGVRGEGGSPTGDPTNLANNYGVLPNDRTHIFNAAYVIQLPDTHSSNGFVKAAANGWQISGITQWQSGVNLQAVGSANFNFNGFTTQDSPIPGGGVAPAGTGLNAELVTGSPDIAMQPTLLCDPRNNLKGNQYINGSCFGLPTPGHNGTFIMPYLRGPSYFDSDLSLFKNFKHGETKNLQFRVSAYNFLNHPLNSFLGGDPNLNLTFNKAGQLTNTRFGYTDSKLGHRIIQLAVKYYF